jgi:hypothetical protein
MRSRRPPWKKRNGASGDDTDRIDRRRRSPHRQRAEIGYSDCHRVASTISQADGWNKNFRPGASNRGAFSRHHDAASGAVWSRMPSASRTSTAYPDFRGSRPSNPHQIAISRLRGPVRTPDVCVSRDPRSPPASGNASPTHFSRTQSGASPGGVLTIRIYCRPGFMTHEYARRILPKEQSRMSSSNDSKPQS